MNLIENFTTDKSKKLFAQLYQASAPDAPERYSLLHSLFTDTYGEGAYRVFSAPGRSEIGGNHTDHNHGRVLAAAITCDTVCFARRREDMTVRLTSYGYDGEFIIDLSDLEINKAEYDSTQGLVRGVAAGLVQRGYEICGFEGYVHSTVLSGSGLSSSAAFEVLIVKIISSLCGYEVDAVTRAIISQFAENKYFGKPSGLMDQTASSVGALIAIDFKDPAHPMVEKVNYDFAKKGYNLVITNTGGSHADLTHDYATIPIEMKLVAENYGKEVLRDVDELEFEGDLNSLRKILPDRALLRAMHFFGENTRVKQQIEAIKRDDIQSFLQMVTDSGESSYKKLQNIYAGDDEQGLAIALNASEEMLKGRGAWRVHGGGFAGTILAFVPDSLLESYVAKMDSIFGNGAAAVLGIRNVGAIEIEL